jgi:hypothetical protein
MAGAWTTGGCLVGDGAGVAGLVFRAFLPENTLFSFLSTDCGNRYRNRLNFTEIV